MKEVSVLFARQDSVYKTLPDLDVWDAERDARNWRGANPVVAHPPCRLWGRLRTFANCPDPEVERELARMAVNAIRLYGGVLEHPKGSLLWEDMKLPKPGMRPDRFGGWTLPILQYWFGHRCEKATWLYIVGLRDHEIPGVPIRLGYPTHVIQSRKRNNHLPHVPKPEREHTPRPLAEWLVELARNVKRDSSI